MAGEAKKRKKEEENGEAGMRETASRLVLHPDPELHDDE